MAAAFLARLEQPKWSPTPTLVSCQAGHPLFQQGVGLLAAEFQRPEAWKQLSRRHLGHHVSKSVTGMLPHRGAHDASYALQAEQELRRPTADHVTGLTLDLRKCFNLLNRCTVRELLLNHGDAYWDIYHTPTSYWMFFFCANGCGDLSRTAGRNSRWERTPSSAWKRIRNRLQRPGHVSGHY